MPKFAVDIDDTLYSFTDLARQALSDEAARLDDERLKACAYAPWSEWRTPPDIIGLEEWIRIIDICHDDEKIQKQTPFVGCAEVLHALVDSGNTIVYISNRNQDHYASTANWLTWNNFPVGDDIELICAGNEPKDPYVKNCQYIIDDRPKTLVSFVYDYNWKLSYGGSRNETKPRKGYGLHRPYNQSLTDVPGIYLAPSWSLLAAQFVRKGFINGELVTA